MIETPLEFLDIWDQWAKIVALGSFGLGLIIYLRYWLKYATSKDSKAKYDLINLKEIRTLRTVSVFVIIALAFIGNSFVNEIGASMMVIRGVVTVSLSVIMGVIVSNMLKFYYPFYVEKRLKKLRYKPRISPKSGKPMKLLSEDEEDVYLDEGMQAEENVFSIDYDVWVDEETGYTKIEKYSGHLHAIQCPECNYQTLKVDREQVITPPTELDEGELNKFFECTYCGHKDSRKFKISRLRPTESDAEATQAVS